MFENVNPNLAIMIGLWIVTIATVPIYYWYKIWQRKTCEHEYENYRFCPKCGIKEKAIEPKEETKKTSEELLNQVG
jgi:hypothetical protein